MSSENKKEQKNQVKTPQQSDSSGEDLLNAILNMAKLDSIRKTAEKSPEEIAKLLKVLLKEDE